MGTTRCGSTEFRWGERTYVMGIVNVTPDSFSGDGLGGDVEAAVRQARRFAEDGADVIDVGGYSTRPGHRPVEAEEELRRVVPVVERLAAELPVPVSIDTFRREVAEAAVAAGARMLNDVWGLKRAPELADLAARERLPLVIMHNQEGTSYGDLLPDIIQSLRQSMTWALERGVGEENIILDPGVGFGKTVEHNLELMRRLHELRVLGRPLLLGTSRKSMIGLVLDLPVDDRVEGTAATVALGIGQGVDMVRVHDVKAMVRVARMSDAIVRGWAPA